MQSSHWAFQHLSFWKDEGCSRHSDRASSVGTKAGMGQFRVNLIKNYTFLEVGQRMFLYPGAVSLEISPSINLQTKCHLIKTLRGHKLPTIPQALQLCSESGQCVSSGKQGPFAALQKKKKKKSPRLFSIAINSSRSCLEWDSGHCRRTTVE